MSSTGKFDRYIPHVLLRRLVAAPEDLVETREGTVVFVDASGFTRLSERLARKGREGAERLTDAINACFSALLADAHANGGSLIKFGGDALLLWFEGDDHPLRACASAVAMRTTIRRVGRIRARGAQIILRMSAGVHIGEGDDGSRRRADSRPYWAVWRPGAGRICAVGVAGRPRQRARRVRRFRAGPSCCVRAAAKIAAVSGSM
jgi:class 3 adenylate cyclase